MIDRLLKIDEVSRLTTLAIPTIYKRMANGTFPKPLSITGTTRKAWRESTIETWIDDNTKEAA